MKVGALFAGYGGLEDGVAEVFSDVELAWYSEIDDGACRIMTHNHPGVENLGDITKVDWSRVTPVEILCGGFPCQDLSDAGKKAGLRDGTRSGLWSQFAMAIDVLRPRLVVIENVRGLLNADAHCDLECEACVDSLRDEPALRALGAVLGDLAELGYDASWHGLRASEVGAPHARFRVFIVAWPVADTPNFGSEWGRFAWGWRSGSADSGPGPLIPTPTASDYKGSTAGRREPGMHRHQLDSFVEGATLLPTPRATDGTKGGPNQRGSSGDRMLPSTVPLLPTPDVGGGGKTIPEDAKWSGKAAYKPDGTKIQVGIDQIHRLLPTPTVVDMGGNKTPEEWDEWTDEMRERHCNGLGHGDSLNVEVQRLLPTPDTTDGGWSTDGTLKLHGAVRLPADRWGEYAPAIERWEAERGPAPEPVEPGPNSPRLAPEFSEWMMGLPAGRVTDPAIWEGWRGSSRNAKLKALGNGVVPQQAAAGIRACIRIAMLPVESAWETPKQAKVWGRALRRAKKAAAK